MKYIESNGYIVVNIDGKNFIVDAGSPQSFNFLGMETIRINGAEYPVNGFCACRKADADNITLADVAGFIGIDLISRTGLTIDYENKSIEFGVCREMACGTELYYMPFNVLNIMGFCYLTTDNIIINGTRLHMTAIDTGAPVSYFSADVLAGVEPSDETYDDASPLAGRLSGNYYGCRMSFDSTAASAFNYDVKVGKMQGTLAGMTLFGICGVVDAHLLSEKLVIFDFENEVLGIALDNRSKR